MLLLERISKSYGDSPALHPLDLAVPAGQTCVLLGPSGCGKSTLLRLIVRLIAPTTGRVMFDGQEVGAGNARVVRRRTGFVIQEGGLFPHLTLEDNVALAARHLGWKRERIAARLGELLALTGLSADLLSRYPGQLSGGQRQRVSLMRALMLDPDVLLLDEPLGALDPLIRFELQQQLRDIFQSLGKTVVLVTHDLHEAAMLGERIVLLRDGRVVQQGGYRDLLDNPADPFVTTFVRAQQAETT